MLLSRFFLFRLEECEDLLRGSEQANEQILHESQTRIRAAVVSVAMWTCHVMVM